MRPETLDYRSPVAESHRKLGPLVGIAVFGLIVFVVNLVLGIWVATDGPGGWADLVVALAAGPIANLILLLSALFSSPWMKRFFGGRTFFPYVIASLALPAFGYYVLYILITGQHLR